MMKLKLCILTISLFLCISQIYAAKAMSKTDKLSYTMGYQTGVNFKTYKINIDSQIFAKGLQDALSGKKSLLSKKEQQAVIAAYQQEMMKKMQHQATNQSAQNIEAGAKFLADNAKKPSVETTASGLQYKILDEGKGDKPTAKDIVTVDYEGKFIGGKIFDSSYQRGTPATFPVSGVIKGWTEALQMMHKGATWELYIPASLAYGDRGMSGAIGPSETLIFKVHLISIEKPANA
ncbi:MAG: FKBP-type peptidyl-prolyl cis-trans isomerase [Gammaproteobacteria bacterium]|nr:FKBP-type peptidyl-prolyl cis-trans isomerase [Gammaproteobacteria bacterium]